MSAMDYRERAGRDPVRIVVHKTSNYTEGECDGIEEAFGAIPLTELLTVRSGDFRMVREGTYPPHRGARDPRHKAGSSGGRSRRRAVFDQDELEFSGRLDGAADHLELCSSRRWRVGGAAAWRRAPPLLPLLHLRRPKNEPRKVNRGAALPHALVATVQLIDLTEG